MGQQHGSIGRYGGVRSRSRYGVIFGGRARSPLMEAYLTLDANEVFEAYRILGARTAIPAHLEGWAILTEGAEAVREAFVRRFANGKALGSYAGLASSPYSSGGIDREQGIGKAGNRRVRTVMVELAWLWTRYQPGAAQVCWFRERVASTGRRVRKIMVVALARKLLIALWRFVIDGVLPEGAVLKPAA